jgi:hypothetical protein
VALAGGSSADQEVGEEFVEDGEEVGEEVVDGAVEVAMASVSGVDGRVGATPGRGVPAGEGGFAGNGGRPTVPDGSSVAAAWRALRRFLAVRRSPRRRILAPGRTPAATTAQWRQIGCRWPRTSTRHSTQYSP